MWLVRWRAVPVDSPIPSSSPPSETLFDGLRVVENAGRLSSDWESTRLKIELSPVQIREAALL
jgi:hypothetical protein